MTSKQLFDIRNNDKSHLLKFGMDYYINDTLSVYTNQNKVNSDNNIDVNIMNQML
jgi:hypothetical protein